jgi:hypothetical protein
MSEAARQDRISKEGAAMGKYGRVALRATHLVRERSCRSPVEAWSVAVREVFPTSPTSQKKGCPKGAYLGLCEAGLVDRIPRGTYTDSEDNKAYAVEAVRLLLRDPSLADPGARDGGALKLWMAVMNGECKTPNGQMDVVLALWSEGLIARQPVATGAAS